MQVFGAGMTAVRRPWHLAVLAALALLVAACAGGGSGRPPIAGGPGFDGQGAPGEPPRPAVKVALLLPLTAGGNTANIAKALKQAGELALFDFDNPNVTLISKDTKGTPEGAAAAATAAVQEGAELIVGPLFAKSVTAAAPIARQASVPMIAFSSDRTVAGNGVYLLSFLAGRDVPRIVSYAISQGKRNFAALIPKTAYGNLVATAFQQVVSRAGGQIVAMEQFPLDANGMLEPARRVAETAKTEDSASAEGGVVTGGPTADVLFLPAGPQTLPTVAALLPYFEVDTSAVKVIGTGLWDYPNVGREKPLVGGWFPAPDPKGWRSFTQRYVKTYGATPPRLSSLSYDAVSLAVTLSSNRKGRRYTPAQLTRSSGFAGVDGLFRLLPDGTSERGLAILEVQRYGPRVIQPAPSAFGAAQF